MKLILLIAIIVLGSSTFIGSKEYINEINSRQDLWQAS